MLPFPTPSMFNLLMVSLAFRHWVVLLEKPLAKQTLEHPCHIVCTNSLIFNTCHLGVLLSSCSQEAVAAFLLGRDSCAEWRCVLDFIVPGSASTSRHSPCKLGR